MKRVYTTYNRKRIDFEDDFVIVFAENEQQIYKGIEDYEPMKDADWKWDPSENVYRFDKYIKICLEV